MQFWFAHNGRVSLREQLVTQVVLGILSDDLAPGERLPSTRELARRFRFHPNTVSSAYRQLERERWIELRRGSGVYVRHVKPAIPSSSGLVLDNLIGDLFRSVREQGIPLSVLHDRLRQVLEAPPPNHFLLLEPEVELRRIIASEVEKCVTLPVKAVEDLRHIGPSDGMERSIVVALVSQAKNIREKLPPGVELLPLQTRSVTSSLGEWLPAPQGKLVAITSRLPEFLKLARTMLIAAGFDPESILVRDARQPGWQRGLNVASAVVCDSVTAEKLPKTSRAIPFLLLAESSLKELRRYEEFITRPLASL